MSRGLKLALVLSLATLALVGCGKRGTLESPTGASVEGASYARSEYSKGDKNKHNKGEAVDGVVAPRPKDKMYWPKPDDTEKQHRDFVLDPLLR